MILILILLLVIESPRPIIDAVQTDEDKPESKVYQVTYEQWREEASQLFSQIHRWVPDTAKVVNKLNRMIMFETGPDFSKSVNVKSIKRMANIQNYFNLHKSIVELTTLSRKYKPVSKNVLDIITEQNGCSREQLSKLNSLTEIFQNKSRVRRLVEKTYQEQALTWCWSSYGKLIRSLLQLTSFHNYFALIDLSERINPKALNDYVDNQYDAESHSIEVLSNGIAKYLISLDHTDLENIPARNLDQLEKILAEVYEIEVYEPCNNLCNLWKPVRNYFSNIKQLPKREKKYILHWIPPIEKKFEFSCKLASFSYTSIGNRVWDHFFNIKTSSMKK